MVGLPTRAGGKSRRARVLIIVENLPVPFDRRVWSEATTLNAAGYDVSVICPLGEGAREWFVDIEGVHVYRHPLPFEGHGALGYLMEYSVALSWELALAFRVFFGRGIDVVHACNPPDLIFVVAAVFKYLFGAKFVFDHHDINPELYEAKFGRRDRLWRWLVGLERATFAIADISIAANQSYRDIAIERGGMAPDRVHVVRSGPRLDRVVAAPPDPRWKRGRKHMVGYVGVIGRQEGLDLLMGSVRHIVESGRLDVQFVIVGDGPALAEIRRLARSEGVEAFVTFTGRTDDATLFSILSTADVCVNPDRPNAMNDKSTMNKVLEYMALGKPIVQYNLREGRYSAGAASLYATNTDPIDFARKIETLLDDPALRQRMGELGRVRVAEEFAWGGEAVKLLRAYDQLLASDGAR